MKKRSNNGANPSLEAEYHCTVEWHLDGPEARLYGFAYNISKTNGFNFYASKTKLAEYFNVDRSTVRAWAERLVESGWFKLIAEFEGSPFHYEVVPHKKWAKEHPDRCAQKITFAYSAEGDPLGRTLFAISGGHVEYKPHKLTALRNLGLDDSSIKEYFTEFMKEEIDERKNRSDGGRYWEKVTWKFYQWLKERTQPQQRKRAV